MAQFIKKCRVCNSIVEVIKDCQDPESEGLKCCRKEMQSAADTYIIRGDEAILKCKKCGAKVKVLLKPTGNYVITCCGENMV